MDDLSLIQLFCHVDDFVKGFNKTCSQEKIEYKKKKKRNVIVQPCIGEGILLLENAA